MNTSEPSFIAEVLRGGGVVVIRTDTLYGIIAAADNEAAVERVFDIKHRQRDKQCIVLVTQPGDVPNFTDEIDTYSVQSETPTSVVVPATDEPAWVLRGRDTIAYRVVRNPLLREVIALSGPVIAPSANPEGQPPAATIEEAKTYFGDQVDLYVDGGTVPTDIHASRIIQVQKDGSIHEIRKA